MKRLLPLLLLLLAPARSSAVVMGDLAWSQPLALGVNSQSRELSLVRSANIGWVRITIPWREVNPERGSWSWTDTDARVKSARAKGLKILAVLSTAPVWAGSNDNGTRPPSQIGWWQQYVRRVAARYTGRIQAYEIWNEPNLEDVGPGVGWAGDLWSFPRYADYLRAAAIQIRTYAPGTLIVGPVTSSQADSRTVDVFRQLEEVVYPDGPASSFLDVVSFHGNARDDQSVLDLLAQIEDQLRIFQGRNPTNAAKPLWLTELGWRVGGGVSEEDQRDRVRNAVEALTGSGDWLPGCELCPGPPVNSLFKWTAVFLYKDMDSDGETRGLYRQDRTKRPVVTDYLAKLRFPARHPNQGYAPILWKCKGRTCQLISTAVEPYVSLAWRYHWDFGDGTTGTGRVVTHTFPKAGQYFVVSAVEDGLAPVASDVRLIPVK
ncbi:MAG: PKD domain-containing protein [Acidobacteriota bacterium]